MQSNSRRLAIAVALCLAASVAQAAATFEERIIDAAATGDDKALADIDGDGFLDVVLGGATLAWYRYPEWTPFTLATATNEFTTDMQAGDVDGDGNMDLVVADAGQVLWARNPGGLTAPTVAANWTFNPIGNFGGYVHDIEVGDVDNNGRLDVVTRKDKTVVWLQTAANTWTQAELPNALPAGEGVGLGDLDGDQDLDLVLNGYWMECPPVATMVGAWVKHSVDAAQPVQVGARVADINMDSRPDIIFAPSESAGALAWFEAPADLLNGTWVRHSIDANVEYVHTFQVMDMDGDGHLDIATAEMHIGQDPDRVGVHWNLGAGSAWTFQEISTQGSHNIRVGDIGNDGDLDIVGANYIGSPQAGLKLWENTGVTQGPPWTYVEVDNNRQSPGGPAFGLAMGDLTMDNQADIVSGPYFYRNPGGDMTGTWTRTVLPNNVDAMAILDVDGDARGDVLAQALPNLFWLEADDANGTSWTATQVANGFPATGHGNGQGYRLADLEPGGKPEFIFTTGAGMYYVRIPADPTVLPWPSFPINTFATEDSLAVGDLDGDNDLDVVGSADANGTMVSWWENGGNPAAGIANWTRHDLGATPGFEDRMEVADLDGNNMLDVIVTDENGSATGSGTFWFANPGSAAVTQPWMRRTIAMQGSTNSLDVADMDGDGDIDVITGEHQGTLKVTVFANDGSGTMWTPQPVDNGKESHLGARVWDLDADGDLDIVSIAYSAPVFLHLWRNNRLGPGAPTQVAQPTFMPPGGPFTGTVSVVVRTTTPGATVRYTTDGTNPMPSSMPYTAPLQLSATTTVRARGYRADLMESAVAQAIYTRQVDNVPPDIVNVRSLGTTGVRIEWTEPLHITSSQQSGNYTLDQGVAVTAAAQSADGTVVYLAVAPQLSVGSYTLTVSGVQDRSGNTVAANTTRQFAVASRVLDGLVALYNFREGSGTTVHDVSGVGAPMDLTVLNPATVQWVAGESGVIFSGGAVQSTGPATKIINALQASGHLTVEAWLVPSSLTQDGPARVVTLSTGTTENDIQFHLGQEGAQGSYRLRSAQSGYTTMLAPGVFTSTAEPTHVMVTYSGAQKEMFVNGVSVATDAAAGDLGNWSAAFPLTLGNEATLDRPWMGQVHLVAIYDRALALADAQQNHAAGPVDWTGVVIEPADGGMPDAAVVAPADAGGNADGGNAGSSSSSGGASGATPQAGDDGGGGGGSCACGASGDGRSNALPAGGLMACILLALRAARPRRRS